MFTEIAKNAALSAMLLDAIASGKDIKDAIDAVLGAGTYDRLASDLYDGLRAKSDA